MVVGDLHWRTRRSSLRQLDLFDGLQKIYLLQFDVI